MFRWGWLYLFAAAACLLASCESESSTVPAASAAELVTTNYGESLGLTDHRKALQQFVETGLSGEEGVYTNFKDTAQDAAVATGHETLSESAGLLLRYYARTGQQEAFDREWKKTKRYLDMETGFSYRYSLLNQKAYTLNAAVDDLRIIRALYEAAEAFKDDSYAELADSYGSRFYRYNVKDGALYDFYDEAYGVNNGFMTLCYADFRTVSWLRGVPEEEREKLAGRMLDIVENGYISEAFPFYETRYTYDGQTYSSEGINTIESLLTILSLAEINRHNPASIAFIKEKVQADQLYGQYTKQGEPANDIRSAAIYAIAAMIGAEAGDRDLYAASIERMEQFRITDPDSPLYEGFGDTAQGQAYSFDNLMALLAYTY